MVKMKRVLELLTSENDEKVQTSMSAAGLTSWMRHDFSLCVYPQERRIKELEESLTKCRRVQELVREKLKEDDYADITDDPSLSVSMEVDQVTLELEGEAGRSCDEELGMKLPLLRKKLQLALQALGSEGDDLQGKLDHNWVTNQESELVLKHLQNVFYEMSISCLFQPRRSSFGGLGSLRRKRQDDGEDYICPMNVEMPKSSSFQRNVHIYEETLDHLQQVGVSTAELS
ncbi:hypothetical protein XENOCAPTIV_025588 [Xenoophorus captivus]|uniref:Uncharacterized protein n=1 Tax=Xenoophorus captivus TaxID=1517983 RepID=A0ABV0QEG7_9TELE